MRPMKRLGVKRYVQIKGFGLVDRDLLEHNQEPAPAAPTIMTNAYAKNPVQSPVDFSLLDSRKAVREHNKRNDVVDIGNDGAFKRPQTPKLRHNDLVTDLERNHWRLTHGNMSVPEHLRERNG